MKARCKNKTKKYNIGGVIEDKPKKKPSARGSLSRLQGDSSLPQGLSMNDFKRTSTGGRGRVFFNRAPATEAERDVMRILSSIAKKRGGSWSFDFSRVGSYSERRN